MLVRGQEGSAQNRVIPIEDDTSLTSLGLVLRSEPNFIVSKTGQELGSDLLV